MALTVNFVDVHSRARIFATFNTVFPRIGETVLIEQRYICVSVEHDILMEVVTVYLEKVE